MVGRDRRAGVGQGGRQARGGGLEGRCEPAAELVNDLEAPVAARHPRFARIVSALKKRAPTHAAMSGSGSAVFGLFARRADCGAARRGRAGGARAPHAW